MAKRRKKPGNEPAAGGQGGGVSDALRDGHHARETAAMVERAIREGWPVSDDVRKKVVEEMAKLLRSRVARHKLSAAKVLIQADSVNAKREDTAAPKRLEVAVDEMSDEELLRIAKGGEGSQ